VARRRIGDHHQPPGARDPGVSWQAAASRSCGGVKSSSIPGVASKAPAAGSSNWYETMEGRKRYRRSRTRVPDSTHPPPTCSSSHVAAFTGRSVVFNEERFGSACSARISIPTYGAGRTKIDVTLSRTSCRRASPSRQRLRPAGVARTGTRSSMSRYPRREPMPAQHVPAGSERPIGQTNSGWIESRPIFPQPGLNWWLQPQAD